MINNFKTYTLNNGLTIYFYIDKKKHSTFVNLTTKFGGFTKYCTIDDKKYELPDGLAHLLEHYVVEANSLGRYTEILWQHNMNTNASTGYHHTSYYFDTTNNLEFGIDILLRSCYSPVFKKELLEEVKKPIYQEIKMYDDNKFTAFNKKQYENIFTTHSFRSIGGSIEDLKQIDIKLLKLVYESFYHPSNQILIVAGNFNYKKVLKQIKNIYQQLDFPKHKLILLSPNEPKEVACKRSSIKLPTTKEYIEIAYKLDLSHFSKEELLKLDFYLHYLMKMNFGTPSTAYKNSLKQKLFDDGFTTEIAYFNQLGILSIGSYTNNPSKLEKIIINTIKNLEFNKNMFELYLKQSLTEVSVRPDSIHSMIKPFLDNVILFEYPTFDSIEYIKTWNFKDFKTLISRLDFSNYSTCIMKKDKK